MVCIVLLTPFAGIVLDCDAGEIVNRYELYVLKDVPMTRGLATTEPILSKIGLNSWHESTIKYLYIRSDIPDAYCQKGRLVFQSLRQGTLDINIDCISD